MQFGFLELSSNGIFNLSVMLRAEAKRLCTAIIKLLLHLKTSFNIVKAPLKKKLLNFDVCVV